MIYSPEPQTTDRKVRTFSLSEKFLDEFRGRQPDWGYNGLGYFTFKRTYARPTCDCADPATCGHPTEEFWQTCKRVVEGCFNIQKAHVKSNGTPWDEPKAQRSAQEMFRRMWDFKFTPPGRGLWMMGTDLIYEKGSAGLQNCAFVSSENIGTDFAGPFTFLMDMSMLGVGVGGDTRGAGKVRLSMPRTSDALHVVEDSREGWVELVRVVLNSFVGKGFYPTTIDFTKVRPRGTRIKGFGGVASGPGPLKKLVEGVTKLLLPQGAVATFRRSEARDLRPGWNGEPVGADEMIVSFEGFGQPYRISSTQIVDVFNYVGKCVVAGGVRRTAEIMFGEFEDDDFINLKSDADLRPLYGRQAAIQADLQRCSFPQLEQLQAQLDEVEAAIAAHPLEDRRWASNNSVFGYVGMDYERIAQSIAKNGEPGICWIDNARQFGRMGDPPTNRDNRVMGTNPCVTGDTLVFTEKGPIRADKLVGRPFHAIVDGGIHRCEGFFQTGVKPVFLLQTEEGHSVRVTADHQILTAPKVTRKKRYEAWVETQDLEPGDRVVLNNVRTCVAGTICEAPLEWAGLGTFEEGWLFGNLLGDGHFHAERETATLQFWGSTKEAMLNIALKRIETLGGDPRYHQMRTGSEVTDRDLVTTGSRRLWELAPEFGISFAKEITNDNILMASSAFQSGFLRGLFDADGSVQGSQTKGVSIRLASSNRQYLSVAQRMLMHFGINSTIYWNRRDEGSRLMPDGKGGSAYYDCEAQHELIVSNDNIAVFADRIGFDDPEKKVKLAGVLEGYQRTLNRERFVATVASVTYVGVEPVFDGTIDDVHRFGANGITVHNCGEQSLESYELCNLVETYPAHHDSLEDFLLTLKMAYLYAKTVTLVPTHDPRANAVMQRNRRIGCSMSGIVQARTKLGHREFIRWCEEGYKEILRLDEVYSEWYGCPESKKTTSVKPSGTVSLLCGATPGIHHPHSEFYIRRIRVANTSPLVGMARKAGLHVEPARREDDCSVISFPVHEKHYSKGKSDVTIWEQFALAAAIQRHWADNQVSVTVSFRGSEVQDIATCLSVYEDQLKSVSMLPLEEHGYVQPPYETIDEETYNRMAAAMKPFDYGDMTGTHEVAAEDKFCSGDTCMLR